MQHFKIEHDHLEWPPANCVPFPAEFSFVNTLKPVDHPINASMTSIELFAGAGGLALGLHRAGFRPIKAFERDPFCCDTLRQNHSHGEDNTCNWDVLEGDVRASNFHAYEGIDLISGGPPCQPFSTGGRHAAFDDDRDMFPQAVRAVREARPRAFVFENVKGLTRPGFQPYFRYIELQLTHPDIVRNVDERWSDHLLRLEQHHRSGSTTGLNYHVTTKLLNAADFGVPQRRERVIFVGFRNDQKSDWAFPEPTHSQAALRWDKDHGAYWDRNRVALKNRPLEVSNRRVSKVDCPTQLPWLTVHQAIASLPDPESDENASLQIRNHKLERGARSYPGHTGSPLHEPAKTLKAGVHGIPGGENMLLKLDGSVRYFTTRESARLQTFPDSYVLPGSRSQAMRQLGNAVPVKLAEVIGRSIAAHLLR